MLRRALVATATSLAILPAALAAPALDFSAIFDQLIKFLGPQGLDFLMAFGLVSAIIYMAVSKIKIFEGGGAAKAGAALFAVIAGLATAFYVYTSKIPFLQLIGPYFMFIVAIVLGLIGIQVISSMRSGESLTGKLATFGIGAIIIGALTLFFSPPLGWVGVLAIVIGIILLIIGGVSGFGAFSEMNLLKTTEKQTAGLLNELETDFSTDFRREKAFLNAQKALTNKAQSILNEVEAETKVGNYSAAIGWMEQLEKLTATEVKETNTELKVAKKLLKRAKVKVDSKISSLEKEDVRQKHAKQLDDFVSKLNKRIEALEAWRINAERFSSQLEKEGLQCIKLIIEALSKKDYSTTLEKLRQLRVIYTSVDKEVYAEFGVTTQIENLMKEFMQVEEKEKKWKAVGASLEKGIDSLEKQVLIEEEQLRKYADHWLAQKAAKKVSKEDTKRVNAHIKAAEKLEKIMKKQTDPMTRIRDVIAAKNELMTLNEIGKVVPGLGARIRDIESKINEIEQLLKEEEEEE